MSETRGCWPIWPTALSPAEGDPGLGAKGSPADRMGAGDKATPPSPGGSGAGCSCGCWGRRWIVVASRGTGAWSSPPWVPVGDKGATGLGKGTGGKGEPPAASRKYQEMEDEVEMEGLGKLSLL